MKSAVIVILAQVVSMFWAGSVCAQPPSDGDVVASDLVARCDAVADNAVGDVIVVVVDDGRERVLGCDGHADYALLFDRLFDDDNPVECDCRDDYDARICYAVLCCRAYRDGRAVAHIIMPLNEHDATKGDMVYPLERGITDLLLSLIAF